MDDQIYKEFKSLRLPCKITFLLAYIPLGIVCVSWIVLLVLVLIFQYNDAVLAKLLLAMLFVLLLMIGSAIFIIVYEKMYKVYRRLYKKIVLIDFFKEFFKKYEFDPEEGISRYIIKSTGLVAGNTIRTNDYIKAKYDGMLFEMSDVSIEQVYRRSSYVCFKGRWMIFEFKKNFAKDLQIREKSFRHTKIKYAWMNTSYSEYHEAQPEIINTGNDAFNAVFDTFAYDDTDITRVVTPYFMQILLKFKEKYKGDMLLCFKENKLHMAINSKKDAFEPPVFKKPDIELEKKRVREDFENIFAFIEELRYDKDIFE